MQSPFEIFRKNQKVLMVVLIGLAMFAFIILDSLKNISDLPKPLLVLLFAVAGGLVAWVIGLRTAKGKQNSYALTGVLVCTAIGVLILKLYNPAAAVETTAGNITEKQIQKMTKDRQLALQFMGSAYRASVAPPEIPAQFKDIAKRFPQIVDQLPDFQEWRQGLITATFFRGPNGNVTKDDMVEKFLLLHEADEMGIRVNDEAVEAFLNRVTNNKLSRNAYLSIRRELKLSSKDLNNILRDELKAMMAQRLLSPAEYITPEQFWSQYRKLNVKQHIETAAIPISAFLDQAPEPTKKELTEYFEKYKGKFPTGVPQEDPAFGQSQKVKLAFFSEDYDSAEKAVLDELKDKYLTDEEIADERKKIKDAIAEVEKNHKAGTVQKGHLERERENARQDYLSRLLAPGRKVKRFEFEIVKLYEDQKNTDYANRDWAAPFQATSGKTTGKSSTTDDLLKNHLFNPPQKPDPKKTESNKTETPKKTEPPKKTSGVFSNPGPGSTALLSAEANLTDDDIVLASTAVLQSKKTTASQKGKKSPAKKTTAKPVPAKKPKPKPVSITVSQPPAPPLPEAAPADPFLPLNAELKKKIRADLLEAKTKIEISRRLNLAAKLMARLAEDYLKSQDKGGAAFDSEKANKELQAEAEKLGLKFQQTDFLTFTEFVDSTAIPFANAQLTNQGGQSSVISVLFSPNPVTSAPEQRLFQTLRMQSVVDTKMQEFVAWKTGHRDQRVPEFEDEGVKEGVGQAWKNMKARELAEKQAEIWAKVVKDSGLPINSVLDKETVTGGENSRAIKTHSTKSIAASQFFAGNKFSWMIDKERKQGSSVSTPPQTIPPKLGPIPNFTDKNIGASFMKTIFNDLADGEVGVGHNEDKSIYYVVRVFDRTPGTPSGRQYHMSQLLKVDLFTGNGIYSTRGVPFINPPFLVRDQLWKKYSVKIQQRPDSNEEPQS